MTLQEEKKNMTPKEIHKFTEELRQITFLDLKNENIRKELTKLGVLIGDIFRLTNAKYADAYKEEPILKELRNLKTMKGGLKKQK